MAYQYTNERDLMIGSMDIRVAPYSDVSATYETAKSIGLLDGVSFKVTGDTTTIESDNSADIDLGMANCQAEIGASAWKNFDLDVIYKIMGQTGSLTSVPGTATTVTDESIILTGIIAKPLVFKNADNTVVTAITVKSADGTTTYAENTDYIVGLTAGGYTTITRVSTGSITTGSAVKVGYTYTPNKAVKMTYGTTMIPQPLHVWLTNINEKGQKFQIEVYRVETLKNQEMSFGSDKAKALMTMPISLIGKPDTTRPANDDLFSYYNEQVKA